MMRVHNPRGRGHVSNQQERRGARSARRGSRLLSTHPTRTAAAAPGTLGPPLRRWREGGGSLWRTGPCGSVKVRDAGLTSILFLHSPPTLHNRSDSRKTSVSITNMSQKHIPTQPPPLPHVRLRARVHARAHTYTYTHVNCKCNILSGTARGAAQLG